MSGLPYKSRVIEEKKELDDKLEKLKEFTISEKFSLLPDDEQGRMNRQHAIMEDYSIVLGERIENFMSPTPYVSQ